MARHRWPGGADDPRAPGPIPTIPRYCCRDAALPVGVLWPVHLRLTTRFPVVWVHQGHAPRSWWRARLAALCPDPMDPGAGAHYLCPVCLPLARGVPLPAAEATPRPGGGGGGGGGVGMEGAAQAGATSPRLDGPSPPAGATASLVGDAVRCEPGDDLARHILELRQLFRQGAVVDGVVREGHRGIELARGSATVRCRACGQEIARVAELAGGAPWDHPHYEYTPAGLYACPRARGCQLSDHGSVPAVLAAVPYQDPVSGAATGGLATVTFRDRP